jgi:aspartate/methionine/tyrosine aminotransferase
VERDRYHPDHNPSGKLALNVAENRLSWRELAARIQAIATENPVPDWVATYTSSRGAWPFREAAAGFLSTHLTQTPVAADHLAVSAGATSVIEMTSFILADSGDVAVIPAPAYPVYRQDIGNFPGVERHDLVTHHELSEIAEGPVLHIEHLERALGDIERQDKRFRMLILTTPNNPTGGILPIDRLEEIADWCIDRRIHLAVNEIYGLSLIDTEHPDLRSDYREPVGFSSFAGVIASRESDYLHLWYALSKDLGISGFRVGLVHSRNAAFLEAYGNLNLSHTSSNHTQWLLSHLLTDDDFMGSYLARNRERLTVAYARVVGVLRRLDVPYVPSRGSHFVWIDLSDLMDGHSADAELALWDDIFRSAGVLLTPGVGFGHPKNGLFRVVYPAVSSDELEVALARLERFVMERR